MRQAFSIVPSLFVAVALQASSPGLLNRAPLTPNAVAIQSGVGVVTIPNIIVQPLGTSGTTGIAVTNPTGTLEHWKVRHLPEFAPTGPCATPETETFTLAPGQSRTIIVAGVPRTEEGVCSERIVINDGNSVVHVVVYSVPPTWFGFSATFDDPLQGLTFEATPAGTCMIDFGSRYDAFTFVTGKALVCWGDKVRITFQQPLERVAFNYAVPRDSTQFTPINAFISFANGAGWSLGTLEARWWLGSVTYSNWMEGFLTERQFQFEPDDGYRSPIAYVEISTEDHQPFIIDNVAGEISGGPAPGGAVVFNIGPPVAMPQSTVTIGGEGFAASQTARSFAAFAAPTLVLPRVVVGGKDALVVSASDTEIRAVVPDLPLGDTTMEVLTFDGRSSGNLPFTVGHTPPKKRSVRH